MDLKHFSAVEKTIICYFLWALLAQIASGGDSFQICANKFGSDAYEASGQRMLFYDCEDSYMLNYVAEVTQLDETLGDLKINLTLEFRSGAFNKAAFSLLHLEGKRPVYDDTEDCDTEGSGVATETALIAENYPDSLWSFRQIRNITCGNGLETSGTICSQNIQLEFYCVYEGMYKFYMLPMTHNYSTDRIENHDARFSMNYLPIKTILPNNRAIFDNMFERNEIFNEDRQELIVDTYLNKTLLKILTRSETAENKFTVFLFVDDVDVNCESMYNMPDEFYETDNVTVSGATIVTTFENITRGSNIYCIRYNLIEGSSKCMQEESWAKNVESLMPIYPDYSLSNLTASDNSTYIVLIIIVLLVTVLVVIIFVIYFKIRGQVPYAYKPDDKAYVKKFPHTGSLSSSQEVLLVYARDCSQFMETVKYFTILLQKYACTVYDIFSDDYAEEISQQPQKWLFEKMEKKDVKIILLLNPCAVHLIDTESPQLLYRTGHCFDQLFTYAVSLLTKQQSAYRNKLFISLLHGQEYKAFNCIPADTRYFLPKHLAYLVAHVKNIKLDLVPGAKDESYRGLVEMCEETIRYYKKNSEYFYEIINIDLEDVQTSEYLPLRRGEP